MIFTSFLIASFKKCHNSHSYLKWQEKKLGFKVKPKLGIRKNTLLNELGNLSQKKTQ